MNNFGAELFRNPLLANQNFQRNMFGGFNYQWSSDIASCSTMPPYLNMSGLEDPILESVVDQSSEAEQVEQVNEDSTSNTEVENDQADFQTWYSEFEEMKNIERNKVNIISR